jgi:glycolate oxidase iron-sulfur subunit
METKLADFLASTRAGREAEEVVRKCVHCGFCNATCPTYQIFGDELDGPRGRIYLIKQVLEGAKPTRKTQLHLDRCLTCRSCETTCPSGVHYSRLLTIGRELVDARVKRSGIARVQRTLLMAVLPRRELFAPLLRLAQTLRPLLPARLKAKLPQAPTANAARPVPPPRHARKIVLLEGCVQPALAPNINSATTRVLDRLGIGVVVAERAGCCGALHMHLDGPEQARMDARRNIAAWWPLVESGAEAIVVNNSACGVELRNYAHLLEGDAAFAEKARRIAALARDLSEIVAAESEKLHVLLANDSPPEQTIAFHSPCTLQHGQKIRGLIENILAAAGYRLAPVADSHLCCGSAGTYSVLLPEISDQLRDNKISALTAPGAAAGDPPALIASANVGCIGHLQSGTALPVRHWIELLDARLERST